jgi:methylthioribose-1-phosphate isomerase
MKQPLAWLGNRLVVIDQTRLPGEEIYMELTDYRQVAQAIKTMQVRGAPAIGVAAGYGIALGALQTKTDDLAEFQKKLATVFAAMAATRPTARNLFQVLERMKAAAQVTGDVFHLQQKLVNEAIAIHEEQREADRRLAGYGACLIKSDSTIITHCNTGPLATAGYGTALGIIIAAWEQGKVQRVFPTETRPLCQGARLTTWELKQAGVPFTLITDSMAGWVMRTRRVDAVIVGADRIAANGDTANKIGTYTLAVLAKEHSIPFYVAAPTTSIDRLSTTGGDIPIEERGSDEVSCYHSLRIAPEGIEVLNPAFDVTPAKYITAIITENGVLKPPPV